VKTIRKNLVLIFFNLRFVVVQYTEDSIIANYFTPLSDRILLFLFWSDCLFFVLELMSYDN